MFTKSHFLEAVAASLADCQSPLNIISRGGLKSSSSVFFFPWLIKDLGSEELLAVKNIMQNVYDDILIS